MSAASPEKEQGAGRCTPAWVVVAAGVSTAQHRSQTAVVRALLGDLSAVAQPPVSCELDRAAVHASPVLARGALSHRHADPDRSPRR